jgi:hypothetical protein
MGLKKVGIESLGSLVDSIPNLKKDLLNVVYVDAILTTLYILMLF